MVGGVCRQESDDCFRLVVGFDARSVLLRAFLS